jgi:hypothetical protein
MSQKSTLKNKNNLKCFIISRLRGLRISPALFGVIRHREWRDFVQRAFQQFQQPLPNAL